MTLGGQFGSEGLEPLGTASRGVNLRPIAGKHLRSLAANTAGGANN